MTTKEPSITLLDELIMAYCRKHGWQFNGSDYEKAREIILKEWSEA